MDKKYFIIMLDNGHGDNTPGKMSPDARIREYAYTRRLAQAIHDRLFELDYNVMLLTPEEWDVPITTRVRRANKELLRWKGGVVISLHLDASGDDSKWHSASGFSARVAINSSMNSKKLARIFTSLAMDRRLTGNRSIPNCGYWSQNLGICRDTKCPAVLTESAFMDNQSDAAFLLSAEGFKRIVDLHVDAIREYMETL